MKKRTLLMTLCALLTFSSCIFDWEEEEVEPKTVGFVTCYTDTAGHVEVIQDDMGNRYLVEENDQKLFPDTSYRMICSYTISEKKTVKILQMMQVGSGIVSGKMIFNAAEEREFGQSGIKDDPVFVTMAYPGSGYLNITLGIKVATSKSVHDVQVVRLNDPQKLTFTVYHDAAGELDGYTKTLYLSVTLTGYNLNKGDTIRLTCRGYDKDYDLKMVY